MLVQKSKIMDEATVIRILKRIAHEIVEASPDLGRIGIVGIRRRGIPLAEAIAANIVAITGQAISTGSLDITLYRDDLTRITDKPTMESSNIPFDVAGRTIILVDDVLYTGRTARAGMDGIFAHGRPAKLQLAVLVDRGHREVPVRADFVGKNIPTSQDEVVAVQVPPFDSETGVVLYQLISD